MHKSSFSRNYMRSQLRRHQHVAVGTWKLINLYVIMSFLYPPFSSSVQFYYQHFYISAAEKTLLLLAKKYNQIVINYA